MQKSFRETARYLASLLSLWTAIHPDRIGIAQAILLPHIPRLSARHACRGREPQTTMASGLRADGEELQRFLLVGEHGSDSDGAANQGFLYRPRNSDISEISRLPVVPGILLVPSKIFGILKLCALKIGL